MKSLRRYHIEGATYFVTCIAFNRDPLLAQNSDILREAFHYSELALGFDIVAWSILPDHFHALIDIGPTNISDSMHRIKQKYSALYRSRKSLRGGRLWQNRFWDHIIRDQEDYNRRLDYIHYNPVHHGLVADPFEYVNSSLVDWYKRGNYQRDWGVRQNLQFDGEFGE